LPQNSIESIKDSADSHPYIQGEIGYTKEPSRISPDLFLIISGGEKREKDFFMSIGYHFHMCVKLLFISKKGQGLTPAQMERCWEQIKESGNVIIDDFDIPLEEFDKTFLITDVDLFRKEINGVMSRAKKCNETKNWIISNPCFEIWLYYCYANNPTEDLKALRRIPIAHRSQQLKILNNKLFPGGIDPRKAIWNMNIGEKNSLQNYSEFKTLGIPKLFSTQMGNFISIIRNRISQEYFDFRLDQIKKFRKTISKK